MLIKDEHRPSEICDFLRFRGISPPGGIIWKNPNPKAQKSQEGECEVGLDLSYGVGMVVDFLLEPKL